MGLSGSDAAREIRKNREGEGGTPSAALRRTGYRFGYLAHDFEPHFWTDNVLSSKSLLQ
jgi:hypothetical protein